MARGGYRRPASPAPVSGPGALSARTDGGPGQPITAPSGLPYGERGALEAAQKVQPLFDATEAGGGGATPTPAPAPPPMPDVFGPTQRPYEDPSTGLGTPRVLPDDPDVLLRELYRLYPHPDILRLLG